MRTFRDQQRSTMNNMVHFRASCTAFRISYIFCIVSSPSWQNNSDRLEIQPNWPSLICHKRGDLVRTILEPTWLWDFVQILSKSCTLLSFFLKKARFWKNFLNYKKIPFLKFLLKNTVQAKKICRDEAKAWIRRTSKKEKEDTN